MKYVLRLIDAGHICNSALSEYLIMNMSAGIFLIMLVYNMYTLKEINKIMNKTILRERRENVGSSQFLDQGRRIKHFEEPDKAWKRLGLNLP